MTTRGLTIIFSGMMAAVPRHGGATWAVLQYVLGLRLLGHEVIFVEPVAPAALTPAGVDLAHSANAAYFRDVVASFGLAGRAALLHEGTHQTVGLTYKEITAFAADADLLINVSGMLTDEALLEHIPLRAYLDLDPAFNQCWYADDGIDMRFERHTHFVSVGVAIGHPLCLVPTCDRTWITTLQPVVLDQWPVADALATNAWTTVANWRGYGSVMHDGVFYGQKAHSLRPFFALPTHTTERFVLALGIHPGEHPDLEALAANGWELRDPTVIAATPAAYQRFIQGSKGEFGIAKSGYVLSRCGWFSDRSVCYLASGRPVLAQDTGFSAYVPTGEGLLAFSTMDDACAGLEVVTADYARHAQAARQLAEDMFEARTVLGRLLDRLAGAA